MVELELGAFAHCAAALVLRKGTQPPIFKLHSAGLSKASPPMLKPTRAKCLCDSDLRVGSHR